MDTSGQDIPENLAFIRLCKHGNKLEKARVSFRNQQVGGSSPPSSFSEKALNSLKERI